MPVVPGEVLPMTAREQIRRTRICLAEIGLETINIQVIGVREDGLPVIGTDAPIPPAVGYQVALLLSAGATAICCWSCYMEEYESGVQGAAAECRAGHCRHPEGPALPPRELLIGLGTPVEAVDLAAASTEGTK